MGIRYKQKPMDSLYSSVSPIPLAGLAGMPGRSYELLLTYLFIRSYTGILSICIYLLLHGLAVSPVEVQTLMKLGIGAVNKLSFIDWNLPSKGVNALVINAIAANAAQPVLSLIYYAYNGIFTSFMLGVEWNNFAINRKGLRVSNSSRGAQRTSYMLQLPKRIAVPLMLLSAILHWLCSQSIFLVSLEFEQSVNSPSYVSDDPGHAKEVITCGFSPIAIVLTVSLGVAMVLAAIFTALRKFKTAGMPVVGSCSAAISAGCHGVRDDDSPEPGTTECEGPPGAPDRPFMGERGHDDSQGSSIASAYSSSIELEAGPQHEVGTEAALLPVKWGVMGVTMSNKSQMVQVGHCGFSSREVTEPESGDQFGYI
jgi:hypothetical protein